MNKVSTKHKIFFSQTEIITLKENKTYSVVENHHIGNKYGAKLDKVRRYIFVAMQLLKGETLKVHNR